MARKTDDEIRRSLSPDVWNYLKGLVKSSPDGGGHPAGFYVSGGTKLVELPSGGCREIETGSFSLYPITSPAPEKPDPPKTNHNPSINNIPINLPFLRTPFGGQGLGKQLPESQGICFHWTGRDHQFFISAQERFEECKMLVTYFIRNGSFVKIGQSTRPSKRLESLQTANPEPLELLLCLPSIVGFREEDMHHRFQGLRRRGEWFEFAPELRTFIREKMSLQKNPMDLSILPSLEDKRLAGCGDA